MLSKYKRFVFYFIINLFLASTAENQETNKSHHSKKKLKMKRQDPSLDVKPHLQKQFDYRKAQHNFDTESSKDDDEFPLNDDPRFRLNSDFYASKRISHQNKQPYNNYESNYNTDDTEDSVRNEDLLDLENDDIVVSENDDFIYDFANNKNQNNPYLKGHKIVARELGELGFEKKISDLVKQPSEDYENEDDYDDVKDRTVSVQSSDNIKTNENGELEEIVEIKKETEDNIMTIFDGQLDIDSNYTGFLELLGKYFELFLLYFFTYKIAQVDIQNFISKQFIQEMKKKWYQCIVIISPC